MLILAVLTLPTIGLLIFFGLKYNKHVLDSDPEAASQLGITLSGTALWACVVSFWLVCLVAGQLHPSSSLGKFVAAPSGIAVVIIGSVIVAVIAGEVLKKLGYPISNIRK